MTCTDRLLIELLLFRYGYSSKGAAILKPWSDGGKIDVALNDRQATTMAHGATLKCDCP